jgi:hypothetical protein
MACRGAVVYAGGRRTQRVTNLEGWRSGLDAASDAASDAVVVLWSGRDEGWHSAARDLRVGVSPRQESRALGKPKETVETVEAETPVQRALKRLTPEELSALAQRRQAERD